MENLNLIDNYIIYMDNHNLLEDEKSWGVGVVLSNKIIKKFVRDSPAYYSNLQTDDKILAVNNELVTSDFADLSGLFNSKVKISFIRDKNPLDITLKRTVKLNKNWTNKDMITKIR